MRRAILHGLGGAAAAIGLAHATCASASILSFTGSGGLPLAPATPAAAAPAAAVPAAPLGGLDLGQKMMSASERASQILGHSVTFDAPVIDPAFAPHFSDTVDRAMRAFEVSPLVLNGREKTITLRKVLFVTAARPDVRLQGDVLKIAISPRMGEAGRPTSDAIFHVLITQAPV